MKKIITTLIVGVICMTAFVTAYAEGSGDENNPTVLMLNTTFDSQIYMGHPADYYQFTLSTAKKVLIECTNISTSKQHMMTLSGNGITPVYTTDSTDNKKMYITAELTAGTYNLSVEAVSSLATRNAPAVRNATSTEDMNYHITVFDKVKNSGYVMNAGDNVQLDDDFEDNNMNNWLNGFRPHFDFGLKAIESETNGNKYIAFTASGTHYYIFEAKDIYAANTLCSKFDIKFPSGDMEIQARDAASNIDQNFKMAGRIRKVAYRLQYYTPDGWEYMLDGTGNWLTLNNVSQWYTIIMTQDIQADKYSIYLMERDSGTIVSSAENISFREECSKISYYAFSSTEKICLDNVKIFETETGVNVDGWTYIKLPSSGIRQFKYFNTLSASENAWSADLWSLVSTTEGVSIDKDTGILSVSPDAKPGTVIVFASRKYCPWIKFAYLVEVDR